MFTTDYNTVLQLIENIDPIVYGKSRNFIDGAVTKLSPYLSRGVINTKQIALSLFKRGYTPYQLDAILKELAWRDYYQQVWRALGSKISTDIKQPQQPVVNKELSTAIIQASTSIKALDNGINELMQTGYMHNHLRMYVASLACNIAQSHWLQPARWMYYYLLDADWASNALSWQWVAASFSNKKYYANQENINKYSYTAQQNTFLDKSYEELPALPIPEILKDTKVPHLETKLPAQEKEIELAPNAPTYIYNMYNLDPNWCTIPEANKVLLLEPSFFKAYPICNNTLQFIIKLGGNIKNLQLFVGEFTQLKKQINTNEIHFKEHPCNEHYKGTKHERSWLFSDVTGYYPSFFSYWKKCEKHIYALQQQAVKKTINA
jgi:deoxyribodipyrimidine photo-lyase